VGPNLNIKWGHAALSKSSDRIESGFDNRVAQRRSSFWFAFAGFVLELATLGVFFTWTYPANRATHNWTVAPANWEQLRMQWEYSHAVNALLAFAALCSVIVAALKD